MGSYSFPHRESLLGREVFNEAELLYPKASIQALIPQISILESRTSVLESIQALIPQTCGSINESVPKGMKSSKARGSVKITEA
jgi:hypothetical protein